VVNPLDSLRNSLFFVHTSYMPRIDRLVFSYHCRGFGSNSLDLLEKAQEGLLIFPSPVNKI
jgi:hypothetical protein